MSREASKYKYVSTKGVYKGVSKRVGAAYAHLWRTHILGCLRRNQVNALTVEDYKKLSSQRCVYCGRPPFNPTKWEGHEPVLHNGIDRVDNTQGYTLENVVTCCKDCNQMKSKRTPEEFVAACQRVARNVELSGG